MASSLLKDYIGRGLAAARPATPDTGTGVAAVYFATDTEVYSVWNGSAWVELISNAPAWGDITGTLSAQTDLQTALNAKLDDSQATAFGLSLLDDADAAAARTTLGLGTAATSASTAFFAASGVSAFGATLVDDADAAAARTTLGLGTAATSASTDFAATSRPTGMQYNVLLAAGQYISQQVNALAPTTGAMAANRLDLVPFVPARNMTIDQMAIEVTTGIAATNCRIGIWADSSGVPGSLLVGGVTDHDCSSASVKTETVSLSMTAGTVYWLGAHSNGGQTFRCCPVGGAPVFGTAAGGATSGYTSWRGTPTYASGLPNPPVSMTRTGGAVVPLIYLRLA